MPSASTVILVYGQRGAGKTWWLRRHLRRTRRLLVVDVTDDYRGLGLDTLDSWRTAGAAMAGRAWRLRLVGDLRHAGREAFAQNAEPEGLARLGPGAAWLAWAARDCVLVLDELAYWCTPDFTPGPLRLIASYGRHRGVSLLGTSRRPAEISRHLSAMADVIVAYRTTEPRDVAYLRTVMGSDANRLPTLARYQPLVFGELARAERILGS